MAGWPLGAAPQEALSPSGLRWNLAARNARGFVLRPARSPKESVARPQHRDPANFPISDDSQLAAYIPQHASAVGGSTGPCGVLLGATHVLLHGSTGNSPLSSEKAPCSIVCNRRVPLMVSTIKGTILVHAQHTVPMKTSTTMLEYMLYHEPQCITGPRCLSGSLARYSYLRRCADQVTVIVASRNRRMLRNLQAVTKRTSPRAPTLSDQVHICCMMQCR